jgi:hypothetical protein
MNDIPPPEQQGRTHTVRPRWTWIALLVMIAGLVLIGVGIVVTSWLPAIPGLVLLVLGGGAGLYGGFFYDVQGGSSFKEQMHDVVEGNERQFPGAGEKRSEDEVKRDVHRRWLGKKA